MAVDIFFQSRACHIFHQHERSPFGIRTDVEQANQVRAFQVHTVGGPTTLHLDSTCDVLQGNLFTGVGHSKVDFAEATATNRPLDRDTIQRAIACLVIVSPWSSLAV